MCVHDEGVCVYMYICIPRARMTNYDWLLICKRISVIFYFEDISVVRLQYKKVLDFSYYKYLF